jgi:uncharacterized repeat protein (TIGR04138 family)
MATPGPDSVEHRITSIRTRDRRFSRNAYEFVLDALDHTMVRLGREHLLDDQRHVCGEELLRGIRDLASEQFGPMAALVFQRWGIRRPEDFGEIVFNLVDGGLLNRRDEDSRLDFAVDVDFEREFQERFRDRLEAISAGRVHA